MRHHTRCLTALGGALTAFVLLALTAPAGAMAPATRPVVRLRILEPTEGETLKGDKVTVRFELKNYDLDHNGQHIHVILDNESYRPHYDENAPVIFEGVKPGTHTIRMFPSRPWHESLKNAEAFDMVTFHVERPSDENRVDWQAPLLTYGRPKGAYKGADARRILLDFWLLNATLHPAGYRVRYTLDGDIAVMLTRWEPSWLEGLAPGEHTITLELLDRDQKPVLGPCNRTTRKITVEP